MLDFEAGDYDTLVMMVDFAATGYHIATFTAFKDEKRKELGIAFVALPHAVTPAVEYIGADNYRDASMKIEHIAGPVG